MIARLDESTTFSRLYISRAVRSPLTRLHGDTSVLEQTFHRNLIRSISRSLPWCTDGTLERIPHAHIDRCRGWVAYV